jgi:hypothetical protein
VAGTAGASDDLYVKVYDGHVYTNWSEFHVNVAGNHTPVVTVPSANVAASAGQALAASGLFSATDADGDTLTYYLYDNTVATTGGHFTLNGTALPNDTMNAVTTAQLAQVTFVAGTAGASDDLYVKVYDGHVYTNWSEFHVNVAAVPTAPSSNAATNAGQAFAAGLFSAADLNGRALHYSQFDAMPAVNSDHLTVNETTMPAAAAYGLTEAQLAPTVAGVLGISDHLFAQIPDSQHVNAWGEFHIFA